MRGVEALGANAVQIPEPALVATGLHAIIMRLRCLAASRSLLLRRPSP
ncbi:MAG: hypothetical protein ACT4P7_22020 [Gemmatimonadaceae bacterium]